MVHTIGETGRVTYQGELYLVEKETHDIRISEDCEQDCPRGWKIPEYGLLQYLRNSPRIDKFNLRNTSEFVQNPDDISRRKGYVAEFNTSPDWVSLECDRDPHNSDFARVVRYVKKISAPVKKKAKPSRRK